MNATALAAAGAAQLAVGSSAGWVCVLSATGAGEHAWSRTFSGAVVGEPAISFSPDGAYMALAGTGAPPSEAGRGWSAVGGGGACACVIAALACRRP